VMVTKSLEQRPIVPHVAVDDGERTSEAGDVSGMSVEVIIVTDNNAAFSEQFSHNCRAYKAGTTGHHYDTTC
jgi:hypothetical protein